MSGLMLVLGSMKGVKIISIDLRPVMAATSRKVMASIP